MQNSCHKGTAKDAKDAMEMGQVRAANSGLGGGFQVPSAVTDSAYL